MSKAEYAALKQAAAPTGSGILKFMANAALALSGHSSRKRRHTKSLSGSPATLCLYDWGADDVVAEIPLVGKQLGSLIIASYRQKIPVGQLIASAIKEKLAACAVLLSILAALACSAQTAAPPPVGNYYLLSSGTNVPPLPLNLRPGYPETQVGDAVIVNDTLSDAQALSYAQQLAAQGINPLTASGPPPAPGPTNGSKAFVQDTNGWMGTFIYGFLCPGTNDLTTANHTLNTRPIFWNIWCCQHSNWVTHVAPAWEALTRVHAGDVVNVFWHLQCSNHIAPWSAFAILDLGTNASGRYTNALVATMPKAGNFAQWMIPSSATISNLLWCQQQGYHPLAVHDCLAYHHSPYGGWVYSTNDSPIWTNLGPVDPVLPPLAFDTNSLFWCCLSPQFAPTNGPLTLTNYPSTNWPGLPGPGPIWFPTFPDDPVLSSPVSQYPGDSILEHYGVLFFGPHPGPSGADFPESSPTWPPDNYWQPPYPVQGWPPVVPPGEKWPPIDSPIVFPISSSGFPGTFDVQIKHGTNGWSTSPADRLIFQVPFTNWVYVPSNSCWGKTSGLGVRNTNCTYQSNVTITAEGTNSVMIVSTNGLGAHFIRLKRL